jgi:PKD repeat protein
MNNTTGATLYRWDFGDGNFLTTTGNNDTIPHLYENAGTYNIKVFASNNCSDTTGYITVTVLPKPKVDFSSIPVTACIGDSVRFINLTDTSTNAVWNFGDGTTSKLINPVHRYTTAGIYKVTLQGIRQYPSGNACIDSITKTVTVVASLPANFTATDTINSCAPSTVTFRNLNLPAANTVWDFGDGNKGTGDVVTHTYTIAGTYKATMSAVTSAGCKYDGSKTIVVQGPRGTWQYDEGIVCGTRPIRLKL